ncbi:MAG: hypothetical protein HFE83_09940 [Lachnospiraceae bacterium]|nr:hypothetical protein [Lachnospiraceae bacterium]
MYTVQVRMKKLGKQRRGGVEPTAYVLPKRPENVRELVLELVELGVREYNERKDTGQLLPYLTKEEIKEKAEAGKVAFGLRGGNDADLEAAEENALQSFLDGIYRIFADETELTGLDEEIPWRDGMVFTFIRLAMLSGL